ncbi:aminotransferase class-III [Hydrogenobacter thermophilus TK-6]|uniref:Aminotransferase n=1 Tax=Hydrogenobacter thermophilus (strain DSM 6534 / IAM 12695 / TK-6) TaxID=608538 RepID=D3DIZ5_HYDTT|nr:aminotransferase class III-fold pyridoxal phosphate-dependent enzyme [Hydrogenobacter thermophilus]ADO45722.1 aminotransferase class-III [Hydrogenobacter thermophilus TK-6]BAI69797.1 aminotransferase [Hydrogenobacter thermophilus TK-6]
MKVGLVVQARNGSTRFPKKMVSNLNGKKLLEWVLLRAGRAKAQEKVVATSNLSQDDIIEETAKALGWKVLRGDPFDVLSRYARAVRDFGLDYVIRITGDCPLVDPKLVDFALEKTLQEDSDYTMLAGIIDGFDVEVIRGEWILKADLSARLPSEREHVSPYIRKSRKAKKLFLNCHQEDLSQIHLSVDYPEDLMIIERLLRELGREDFTYEDVVKLIKEKPHLLERDKKIVPNEGYLRSIQEDREFVKGLKGKSLRLEESLKHFEKTKKLIPNCSQTFSKSYLQFSVGASPLFVEEAKGVYLKDLDGNTYIDYTMGLGACILGYSFEPVVSQVKKQLEKGIVYTLPHRLEAQLAELLTHIIPCAQMVRFGKNGSDVTSAAVRVARAYTGRDMIACCGYHGWQDWYIGTTTKSMGVPEAVKKLTLTFEYNNPQSLERLFEEYPHQIACVIMEPVGIEEPKDNFLQKVREITHKHGALLIFDEVVTGFRFSLGGAQDYFGVVPDLACFGKAMGNGMPISALVGREDIMKLFEDVFFSFTFGGETASIASSIAVINYMRENEVIAYLWEKGQKVREGILKLVEEKELEDVVKVKGYPVRFVVDFAGEDGLKLKTLFQQECAKRGVLFSGSHNISYSHRDEHIEETLRVYDQVLDILKYALEYDMVDELLEGEVIKPVFRKP